MPNSRRSASHTRRTPRVRPEPRVTVISELERYMHPDLIGGFRQLVADAKLDADDLTSEHARGRFLYPLAWIIDRFQAPGVTLTDEGEIPLDVAEEALHAFGDFDDDPDNPPAEIFAEIVGILSERMLEYGMLRLEGGTLTATPEAAIAVDSPPALWQLLVTRFCDSDERVERDAVKFFLLYLATRNFSHEHQYLMGVAVGMLSIGWTYGAEGSDDLMTPLEAYHSVRNQWRLLDLLGGFEPIGEEDEDDLTVPTPTGAAFARAVLSRPVGG